MLPLPLRGLVLVRGWALWRLPPQLRWYILGVSLGAMAAAGATAGLTHWRVGDMVLFAALVCFGAAAVELTKGTGEPRGLVKDVHGIWQLPVVLLLPPVYCLAAPVITFAMLQFRTQRSIVHRAVFSAASSGLSLAAASAAFHVLRPDLGLSPSPAGLGTTWWLLAAAGCTLLWSLANKLLIITAVRLSDPTVSVRGRLLAREPLLNDSCELCAGLLLAAAVAAASWVVLLPALPLVIMLQRSFRHAQLLSASRIDAKTGLLNAAAWRNEASVQVTQTQRTGTPLAVAIADLDHFKTVNDVRGHLAGDAVLAATATTLRAGLRPYDLLGRFGGEEFTFLLPGTGATEAMQVAERLRHSLSAHPLPAGPGREPVPVTISIGVAVTSGADDLDLTDLLAAADTALYAAKAGGRDAVVLSPPGISAPQDRPAQPEPR
jgi:diguanylate cyclase (GGDEF)-like protein